VTAALATAAGLATMAGAFWLLLWWLDGAEGDE